MYFLKINISTQKTDALSQMWIEINNSENGFR